MQHFISGLPRSGSTLLAGLLRQNPKFHASIMSPVGQVIVRVIEGMSPSNEAAGYLMDDVRLSILRGVFTNYYSHGHEGHEVIFDSNRCWCANAALIGQLFPKAKIICCVRSPVAVVDSFERLFRRYPAHLNQIYSLLPNSTVYERTIEIMRPNGVLGYSLNAFRDAYFGPNRSSLVVVNYEDLCQFPEQVMDDLHAALGLPEFDYDFNDIKPIPGAAEFDQRIGVPGLHDLRSSVDYVSREAILPPDLIDRLPDAFWRVKEEATTAP